MISLRLSFLDALMARFAHRQSRRAVQRAIADLSPELRADIGILSDGSLHRPDQSLSRAATLRSGDPAPERLEFREVPWLERQAIPKPLAEPLRVSGCTAVASRELRIRTGIAGPRQSRVRLV